MTTWYRADRYATTVVPVEVTSATLTRLTLVGGLVVLKHTGQWDLYETPQDAEQALIENAQADQAAAVMLLTQATQRADQASNNAVAAAAQRANGIPKP
jgi:hypothetical protein